MGHADTLKLLFPVELGGVYDQDVILEGAALDKVQADAEALLREMFPQTATLTLADWERVCGITPAAGASTQMRQNVVLLKIRERGGLSRPFFIALAASLGYAITITEFEPFTCESPVTDPIYDETVRYVWQVNKAGETVVTEATCVSFCTDPLRSWGEVNLEEEIRKRKPAHTEVIFAYPQWAIEGTALGTEDGKVIGNGEDLGLAL